MALSFRSLLKVATATALLAIPRGVLADTSLGCVAVSSTFPTMVSAVDNSPDTCKATCSKGGYTYYGVSQQFCVCSKTMPTISKTYDSSACNFACSSPNQAQMCGGEDSSTFQFLYNLYEIGSGSGSSAASAASSTAQSTTGTPATPSSSGASASIPADTSSRTPASSSTVSSPTDGTSITVTGSSAASGSAVHGIPQLTSTTEETRVFISTIDCSCTKSSATKAGNTYAVVTSTTEVIETVSCSGGETNPGSQCTNSLITSTIVRTTTLHSSSSVTVHSAQASASSIPLVSRPSPISVPSSIPPISLPSPISVSYHSTFSSSESSRSLLSSDFIEPSSSVPSNSRTPSTTSMPSGSGSGISAGQVNGGGHTHNAVPGSSAPASSTPSSSAAALSSSRSLSSSVSSSSSSSSPSSPISSMASSVSSSAAHFLNSTSSYFSKSSSYLNATSSLSSPSSSFASDDVPAPSFSPASASAPTSASTYAPAQPPPAQSAPPVEPSSIYYDDITTEEVLITVVPLSTAAAMSTHTTSSVVVVPQNNNHNGPYRNTTMVTAKPVSPTVSSTSPHASVSNVPGMVVTAAGLRTFDQVSLTSKEWYLTLVGLTVAFILL